MSLWSSEPISAQPEIVLSNWRIFEINAGTRHFVGKNLTENGTGRVSSAISNFDKLSMSGSTRSGRVYKLLGDPGHNHDAMYVWNCWCAANGVQSYEDVTSDVSLGVDANPLVSNVVFITPASLLNQGLNDNTVINIHK